MQQSAPEVLRPSASLRAALTARPSSSTEGPPGSPSELSDILERSVWARPGDQALCVRIFEPRGQMSRGTVVLAPPMGREWMSSHVVIRQLALRLAAGGWTVARVAWRGSGDSAILREPDAVTAWEADILETAQEAQRLCGTGGHPLHLIGYRLGAALAARVAEQFETTMLWEPCGGRVFLRQWHRARRVWMEDVPEGDGVDALALWLTAEQAASVEALPDPVKSREGVGGDAQRVLVWKEADPRRAKVMYAVDPLSVRVHDDVLDDLIALLPESAPMPVAARQSGRTVNILEQDGVRVAEELLEIEPGGWPAVLSGPVDAQGELILRGDLLPVLLVSAAAEPADCGGLWTAAARQYAARGRVCLRADRQHCGDHGLFGEHRLPIPFSDAAAAATRQHALWFQRRVGGPIAGAGLSAGGWALLRALNEQVLGGHAPDLRVVMAINTTDWRAEMHRHAWERELLDGDADYQDTQKLRGQAKGIEGLSPTDAAPASQLDWKGLAMGLLPYPLWRLLGLLRIRDIPELLIDPAAGRTRVVSMVGSTDLSRLARGRVTRAFHRMRRKGHPIDIVVLDEVDHGVLTERGHQSVRAAVERELDRADARLAAGRRR